MIALSAAATRRRGRGTSRCGTSSWPPWDAQDLARLRRRRDLTAGGARQLGDPGDQLEAAFREDALAQVDVVLEAAAGVTAHAQRQLGHRQLVPTDSRYIECTALGKLHHQEGEVVLARLDSAAHAHDEVEMRRQLDHAILRQAHAALDVAHVVAL